LKCLRLSAGTIPSSWSGIAPNADTAINLAANQLHGKLSAYLRHLLVLPTMLRNVISAQPVVIEEIHNIM
jgi:hypothetical protein